MMAALPAWEVCNSSTQTTNNNAMLTRRASEKTKSELQVRWLTDRGRGSLQASASLAFPKPIANAVQSETSARPSQTSKINFPPSPQPLTSTFTPSLERRHSKINRKGQCKCQIHHPHKSANPTLQTNHLSHSVSQKTPFLRPQIHSPKPPPLRTSATLIKKLSPWNKR